MINQDASSGVLWSVKAFHILHLETGTTKNPLPQNERDRSTRVIEACNDEISRRHGALSVLVD